MHRSIAMAAGLSASSYEPPLPLQAPWRRCLYCSSFELWEGTLPFCLKHQHVLRLIHALERRCLEWKPGATALKTWGTTTAFEADATVIGGRIDRADAQTNSTL
jgi:hypothetical protein